MFYVIAQTMKAIIVSLHTQLKLFYKIISQRMKKNVGLLIALLL